MSSRRIEVIEARLDVLTTVLQAVCQVLDHDQTAAVLLEVEERVNSRVSAGVAPAADEGLATELAPLLGALKALPRHGGRLVARG